VLVRQRQEVQALPSAPVESLPARSQQPAVATCKTSRHHAIWPSHLSVMPMKPITVTIPKIRHRENRVFSRFFMGFSDEVTV
jgi:hypothetical protein